MWAIPLVVLGCDDEKSKKTAASASASSAAEAPSAPGLSEPFVDPVDGDAAGKKVQLRFAWPEAVVSRMDTIRKQERSGKRQSAKASWAMNVSPTGKRRVIVMEDYKEEKTSKGQERNLDRGTLVLGTLVPDMVVSPEGKFISVENPARSVSKMHDYFFEIVPGVDRVQASLQLDQVLNPKTLTIKGQSEWAWIVENWIGLDVVLDEEAETDEMSPPGIGGIPEIRFVTTYRAIGMVPCTRNKNAPKKCVRIEGVSKPPQDQLENFAKLMFSQLAGSAQMGGQVNVDNVALETTFTLVTEQATLVPHYMSFKRKMSADVSAAGKGSMPMREVDEQERRFRYPAP